MTLRDAPCLHCALQGLDAFLDAPLPYVIGASPDCLGEYRMRNLPTGVVVVNLDDNTVSDTMPEDQLLPLRQSIKLFRALLR